MRSNGDVSIFLQWHDLCLKSGVHFGGPIGYFEGPEVVISFKTLGNANLIVGLPSGAQLGFGARARNKSAEKNMQMRSVLRARKKHLGPEALNLT